MEIWSCRSLDDVRAFATGDFGPPDDVALADRHEGRGCVEYGRLCGSNALAVGGNRNQQEDNRRHTALSLPHLFRRSYRSTAAWWWEPRIILTGRSLNRYLPDPPHRGAFV